MDASPFSAVANGDDEQSSLIKHNLCQHYGLGKEFI